MKRYSLFFLVSFYIIGMQTDPQYAIDPDVIKQIRKDNRIKMKRFYDRLLRTMWLRVDNIEEYEFPDYVYEHNQ